MYNFNQLITFPLDKQEVIINASALAAGIIDNEDAVIQSGQRTESEIQQTTNTPDANEPVDDVGGIMSFLPVIIIYGGLGLVLYFFLFRPQRKREKQAREMQDSLKVGDNVVTSSGLYGKIVEVGKEAHVIEFGSNRGVRIPVRKSDILGIQTPVLTPPHNKDIPVTDTSKK